MRNCTKPIFTLVTMLTLFGCESFGLIQSQSSPATTSNSPAPASASPDTTSAEATLIDPNVSEPVPAEATPTPTVAAPKLQVAVLNPSDLMGARARHKQALSEALGDSLAGTDVGYYMDIQAARFIQLLRESTVNMKHEADIITLKMSGGDSFDSNSARLTAGALESLTLISQVLNEFNKTQIIIYGHTDDAGGEDYNQKLSVRRAMSVAQQLVDQGIDQQRIAIVGYGESQPVSTNITDEGRAQNRRIELQIEPVAQAFDS